MKTADIVQLPQIICEECHKREATILCDYDIGYNIFRRTRESKKELLVIKNYVLSVQQK